jgi:hypothetical protein
MMFPNSDFLGVIFGTSTGGSGCSDKFAGKKFLILKCLAMEQDVRSQI